MKYPCPHCSHVNDLYSSRLGQEVDCRNCEAAFVVRALPELWADDGHAPESKEITAEPQPLTSLADDPDAPAGVAPAKRIRFSPLHCPACGEAVACGYSRYRHARHRLYRPLLLAGVVVTVAAALLAVLLAAQLTAWGMEGREFREMESGVIYLAAMAVPLAAVWALSRLWWQALHRLPRRFEYECDTCGWAGPCEVTGLN